MREEKLAFLEEKLALKNNPIPTFQNQAPLLSKKRDKIIEVKKCKKSQNIIIYYVL